MLLDQKVFLDAGVRQFFLTKFESCGVENSRLILQCASPHWGAYSAIDIALDPFPHNAGTTTVDALWMGVPVVSLEERPPLGRFGKAILTAVGLESLVAKTHDEYIDIALQLSRNTEFLTSLRSSLRQRLLDSPLMNQKEFAIEFFDSLQRKYEK